MTVSDASLWPREHHARCLRELQRSANPCQSRRACFMCQNDVRARRLVRMELGKKHGLSLPDPSPYTAVQSAGEGARDRQEHQR